MTDESMITRKKADPLMSVEYLQPHAARYIGKNDPHSPLNSPIYADLRGMPLMLIQVGD